MFTERPIGRRDFLKLGLVLPVALYSLKYSQLLESLGRPSGRPSLPEFIKTVENGNPDQIVGVYSYRTLANKVVQQPPEDPAFVSPDPLVITQFRLATSNNVIGFLGHREGVGREFLPLINDEFILVVYGDGRQGPYKPAEQYLYQALEPNSPESDFINLKTGIEETVTEVYNKMYRGPHHVTFQTCIAKDGNPIWGRYFLIASPYLFEGKPVMLPRPV